VHEHDADLVISDEIDWLARRARTRHAAGLSHRRTH